MTSTDAELALDRARMGRRVLIVVRRATDATPAIDRLSAALSADDGAKVRRAAGLWRIELPAGGRIDVRPASSPHALRGLSADVLLIAAGVQLLRSELLPIVAASSHAELFAQRDL